MTDDCGFNGNLLPDDQRAFPLGTFLRRCSLDELPQLLNVIKGDMSLIGPRPWIPDQLSALPRRYCIKRYQVRPGLSGLAQIYGRNGISFCSRLCYDMIYIANLSFRMDIKIIFLTVLRLFDRKGIQQCKDAFLDTRGNILIQHDLSQVSCSPAMLKDTE